MALVRILRNYPPDILRTSAGIHIIVSPCGAHPAAKKASPAMGAAREREFDEQCRERGGVVSGSALFAGSCT